MIRSMRRGCGMTCGQDGHSRTDGQASAEGIIPSSITGQQKRSVTQRCGVQAARTEAGKACLTAGQKTVFGSAGQSRKTDGGADKKGAGKETCAGRSQCEGGDGKKRCTQAADVAVSKRGRIFRFRSSKIGGYGNSKCRL